MNKTVELLKVLADETRLAIIAELMERDSYVEKLAEFLSLTPATVCYHLKKMQKVGLVNCSRTQFYMIYSLNLDIFDLKLCELVDNAVPERNENDPYRDKVIKSFFRNGQLISLPVQKKKREIVLHKIADFFEPKRDYTECEVNEIISRFHEDFCSIRRELVDFGILERKNNTYHRV